MADGDPTNGPTNGPTNWKGDFYARLEKANLAPLWERLHGLVPSEPKPQAQPCAWSFSDIKPYMLEGASLISAEDAERRVLILENPGLPGQSRITDTLYAGIQTLLPGEVAPAHRHTQSALRFVLDGEGAFTTVDGERTTMHAGDFIITPAWTWHDHIGANKEPMIWLDGLDVPLVTFLRAGFREESDEPIQDQSRPEGDSLARFGQGLLPLGAGSTHTSPVFNYPYARTREALQHLKGHSRIDPHHGLALRYVNPTNGDWAIPTIATAMRLLPRGFSTLPYRSTDGVVFIVMEGEVEARVGDTVLTAGPKDVFVAPGWTDFTLTAREEAIVFSFSDRPVYEKLGLWRERKTPESAAT